MCAYNTQLCISGLTVIILRETVGVVIKEVSTVSRAKVVKRQTSFRYLSKQKKSKWSEKGDLMVYLKVVRFIEGTFKWNKPAEPEPPTKNSPTRIHNTCIQVYKYTILIYTHIQLLKSYVQVLIIMKRSVNIL